MNRYKAGYKNLDIIKKNIYGIKYLEYKQLTMAGVRNIMTTKDMDLGFTTNYGTGTVEEQYHVLLKALGGAQKDLYLMRQVHSKDVLDVADYEFDEDKMYKLDEFKVIKGIDGLITNSPLDALSVTVADCVPLVIFDPINKVISNLHSGWSGTYLEIGRAGLELMNEKYGTNPSDCLVFMGPHIGADDFEVTKELADKFIDKFGERYLVRKSDTHWLIDLNSIICDMFVSLGVDVQNIYGSDISTFSNDDIYHSYRRDGEKFGIMSLTVSLDI